MLGYLILVGLLGLLPSLGLLGWLIRKRRSRLASSPKSQAAASLPSDPQRPGASPNAFRAYAVAILAYAVGGWLLASQLADYTEYRFPIRQGTVLSMELRTSESGQVDRPYLTIQVDGTQEIVHAFLIRNGPGNSIPRHVHFPYSGDATREVWLLEENNDLRGGLGLVAIGAIAHLLGYLISKGAFPFHAWGKAKSVKS